MPDLGAGTSGRSGVTSGGGVMTGSRAVTIGPVEPTSDLRVATTGLRAVTTGRARRVPAARRRCAARPGVARRWAVPPAAGRREAAPRRVAPRAVAARSPEVRAGGLPANPVARLALLGGRVYAAHTGPLAPRPEPVEALGVAGPRVAVAGERDAVLRWLHEAPPTPEEATLGRDTAVETVDLAGAALLPGFVDAHVHLNLLAVRDAGLALGGLTSVERVLDAVAAEAARLPAGAPLVGVGWDDSAWGRLPTRDDLDRVAPDRPVLLLRKDAHLLWLNSAALTHYGFETRDRLSPREAAFVDREKDTGRATGLVRETLALELLRDRLPPTPAALAMARLDRTIRAASAAGVTGVTTFEGLETATLLRRRLEGGARDLRVALGVPASEIESAARLERKTAAAGGDWLAVGPAKLFLDGSLGSRTARLLEPYEAAGLAEPGCGPDGCGLTVTPDGEARAIVREALAAGFPLAVHAIGDAAVRAALDAFEAARASEPSAYARLAPRSRVEHVQLCHPADLPRFAALGVAASVQPAHAPSDMALSERYWGAARSARAYPYGSLARAGARLVIGTDAPVEPIAPLVTLHAAITRQRRDGTPAGGWHAHERLDAATAIDAYTLGSASYAGLGMVGRLAPGWLADAVAVSVDPFRDPPERLAEAEVRLVVVDGRVVFAGGRPASP
jgi:hypothetical protein